MFIYAATYTRADSAIKGVTKCAQIRSVADTFTPLRLLLAGRLANREVFRVKHHFGESNRFPSARIYSVRTASNSFCQIFEMEFDGGVQSRWE